MRTRRSRAAISRKRFPIPMRGNELKVDTSLGLVFGFPIPMRGNELLQMTGSLSANEGSRSP